MPPPSSFKLHLETAAYSIGALEDIELPSIVVVHGENGAGKTHLLRSIAEGHVSAKPVGSSLQPWQASLSALYVWRVDASDPFLISIPEPWPKAQGAWDELQRVYWNNPIMDEIIEQYVSPETRAAFESPADMQDLRQETLRKAYRDKLPQLGLLTEGVIQILKQSSSLGDKINNIVDSIGVDILSITVDDIANNWLWSSISTNMGAPQVGLYFHKYYELRKRHVAAARRASHRGLPSRSDEDFVARHGEEPWKVYNRHLEEIGIEIRVSEPINYDGGYHISFVKNGRNLSSHDLSSGEQVIANLALSTLSNMGSGLVLHKPDLLLLDEPDAHLHPTLVKDLFNQIISPLAEAGMRIIVTTHSPTTVAQAPEGHIFEKIAGAGLVSTTRQSAVDKLLVSVPHIALDPSGRRQVFVESTNDELILQSSYDAMREILGSERSLSFIATGSGNGGGKERVKGLVRQLRSAGARGILGVIDWDGIEASEDGILVNGEGTFHSVENIFLNPLVAGSLLVKVGKLEDSGVKFKDIIAGTQAPLQAVVDFIENGIGDQYRGNKINIPLIGGIEVNMSEALCSMNGHNYELLLFEKFPALRGVSAANQSSLIKSVVRQIVPETYTILPAIVLDTMKHLLEFI